MLSILYGKFRKYSITNCKTARCYQHRTASHRFSIAGQARNIIILTRFLAAQWAATGRTEPQHEDITLYEAITRYISSKQNVLSPSTLRGYEGMQRNYFKTIGRTQLKSLDNTTLQIWISDLAKRLSPKTVRNIHGLLTSTLDMFLPDFTLKTTLPARQKPDLYTPSDDDIRRLLDHISRKELEIAVLLAAFGPMRRGEICALTSDDIHGNIVDVNITVRRGSSAYFGIKV